MVEATPMTTKPLGLAAARVQRAYWSSAWTMHFAMVTQSMRSLEARLVTTLVGRKASRCLGGLPRSNYSGTYTQLPDLAQMTRLLSRYVCYSAECLKAS